MGLAVDNGELLLMASPADFRYQLRSCFNLPQFTGIRRRYLTLQGQRLDNSSTFGLGSAETISEPRVRTNQNATAIDTEHTAMGH